MKLLAPARMGDLALANRIVMAPLGRARAQEPSREQLPRAVTYYSQRASAGLLLLWRRPGIHRLPDARAAARPGMTIQARGGHRGAVAVDSPPRTKDSPWN
jgi:2,4-dienoyl-CoA reductase-like NADH-dependent reductase (Old Yellow Enzyme family)